MGTDLFNQNFDSINVRDNNLLTFSNNQNSADTHAKLICDEITFMLYDLERGKHIGKRGTDITKINDEWSFKYRRQTVKEYVVYETQIIISNFFVTIWNSDKIVLKYEIYGSEKRLKILDLQPLIELFLDVLDEYRKLKFGVSE